MIMLIALWYVLAMTSLLQLPPERISFSVQEFGGSLVQTIALLFQFLITLAVFNFLMLDEKYVTFFLRVLAIVIAVGVMMFSAAAIGRFVDDHPTIKMLALSFLVLIGVALIAEGIDLHIPKGYIYFAMAFSVAVEMLNLHVRRGRAPVHLHKKEPR